MAYHEWTGRDLGLQLVYHRGKLFPRTAVVRPVRLAAHKTPFESIQLEHRRRCFEAWPLLHLVFIWVFSQLKVALFDPYVFKSRSASPPYRCTHV